MNNRIEYIDIAKGILMSFLLFHHEIDYSVRIFHVENNDLLNTLGIIQKPLFLCYFMQAFFFITGYCTNFNKPILQYTLVQIKTLLLPAFLFSELLTFYYRHSFENPIDLLVNGGMYWFLLSLFLAKMLYWFVHKIQKQFLIAILLLAVSFLGTYLNQNDTFPNFWYHRQAMDLCFYLFCGHIMKTRLQNKKLTYLSIILYIVTITFCFVFRINIPHVTAGFCTTINDWLLHVILSVSGTISFLTLCSYLKDIPVVNYIGRNSIVIYLFQNIVLMSFLPLVTPALKDNAFTQTITSLVLVFLASITLTTLFAYILNKKYLVWAIGKF